MLHSLTLNKIFFLIPSGAEDLSNVVGQLLQDYSDRTQKDNESIDAILDKEIKTDNWTTLERLACLNGWIKGREALREEIEERYNQDYKTEYSIDEQFKNK